MLENRNLLFWFFLLYPMKKYFVFLLLFTLFSCKENLTGFWRTEKVNGTTLFFRILENNDAYIFLSLNEDPVKGVNDPSKNKLFFPGQCGSLAFHYEYKLNTLFLTSELGEKVIAKRVEKHYNRIEDFPTKLDMKYLIIKESREDLHPLNSLETHLKTYINISYSQYQDSILLEYDTQVFSLENIDNIMKDVEQTHADAEIPYIHYVITPDQNITTSDLKKIVNTLPKQNTFYLRTLKPKIENYKLFEYIPLQNINLNIDRPLKEIIH